MELAFVFIEDFKIIHQKLFNFDGRFIFKITPQSQKQGSYNLKVSLNEDFVNIFPKRVTSMTCLVGMNGSGKSSVLNCIKLLFGQLKLLTVPLIFGFFEEKKKKLHIYYYNGGGIDYMVPLFVEVLNLTDNKINIPKPTAYKINRLWDNPDIEGFHLKEMDTACCYFSNAFDSNLEVVYENIQNISTNYKLEEFLKRHVIKEIDKAQKKEKNKRESIQLWPSHIAQFYTEELVSKIKFIAYANTRNKDGLPPLPDSLGVTFNFDDLEAIKDGRSKVGDFDKDKLSNIQEIAIRQITKSDNQKQNFFNLIILCSFYHCLSNGLLEINSFNIDSPYFRYDNLINEPELIFEKISAFLSENHKSKKRNIIPRSLFSNKIFEKSLDRIKFVNGEVKKYDKTVFSITIDKAFVGVIQQIYELPGFENSKFLKFDWRGLSTGEEALLTQYSRFYELKVKVREKNLLILIDEGDLYFHPQWQKEYISRLLQFIPFIFFRKNLQLILTSHSPFIASDLPKQNLIFLEKSNTNRCEVVDSTDQPETFGANIHELFTHSFFLKDGLMGEYARTSIEKLIKEINDNRQITQIDFERKFKNRINIIGESFIKAKLLEMISQKGDNELIDRLIAKGEDELKNLRNIRNTRQND